MFVKKFVFLLLLQYYINFKIEKIKTDVSKVIINYRDNAHVKKFTNNNKF